LYAGFVNRASGSSAKHPAAEHSTVCCVPAGPRRNTAHCAVFRLGGLDRNTAQCAVFRSGGLDLNTAQCAVFRPGPSRFKGPRCASKGHRGPLKESRCLFKGHRGPLKGHRGPLKEPRTTAMATSTTTTSVGPRGAPVVLPWCSRGAPVFLDGFDVLEHFKVRTPQPRRPKPRRPRSSPEPAFFAGFWAGAQETIENFLVGRFWPLRTSSWATWP